MARRFLGANNTVSSSSASGIFDLRERYQFKRIGSFPALSNDLTVTRGANTQTYSSGDTFYLYHNNSNTPYTMSTTGNLSIRMHVWGAGGGGGRYTALYKGGNGGLVYGDYAMSNETLYAYVGQGGDGADNTTTAGTGGWPNGGDGTQGDASGSGGGGMSMISKVTYSTSMANTNILLIGGAGGGSTGYIGFGGSGGIIGKDGYNTSNTITGGTQTAGGTYNGAYLVGGDGTGSVDSGTDDGGGGGGGFFGGGGGTSDAKPGAGGSSWILSSLTNSGDVEVVVDNRDDAPPNRNSLILAGYAEGGLDSTGAESDGEPGLIHIEIL